MKLKEPLPQNKKRFNTNNNEISKRQRKSNRIVSEFQIPHTHALGHTHTTNIYLCISVFVFVISPVGVPSHQHNKLHGAKSARKPLVKIKRIPEKRENSQRSAIQYTTALRATWKKAIFALYKSGLSPFLPPLIQREWVENGIDHAGGEGQWDATRQRIAAAHVESGQPTLQTCATPSFNITVLLRKVYSIPL